MNPRTSVYSNSSSTQRTGSEISLQSSITAKGERLPPLPPSIPQTPTSPTYDTQATIRHAEPPVPTRVPPDLGDDDEDDEDYGELLDPQPYPHMEPQHDKHLQDLPDTAMLDSVVLPAIASVSRNMSTWVASRLHYIKSSCFPAFRPKRLA